MSYICELYMSVGAASAQRGRTGAARAHVEKRGRTQPSAQRRASRERSCMDSLWSILYGTL